MCLFKGIYGLLLGLFVKLHLRRAYHIYECKNGRLGHCIKYARVGRLLCYMRTDFLPLSSSCVM